MSRSTWMGPWFGRGRWFGPWFDSDRDNSMFAGYGPAGVATLALEFSPSLRVRYHWETNIIPRKGGVEQRISTLDAPQQFYGGAAVLSGSAPRSIRSKLALYSAAGSTFLLGLPYEEITLSADRSGSSVFVNPSALAKCDWAKTGQRVVLVGLDETTSDGIVQSASGGTIVLDRTIGTCGLAGGRIMPAMAVIFEPQQGFSRHPVNAEEWGVRARAAIFDFAAQRATLPLDTYTVSAAFNNVTIVSRLEGVAGNDVAFGLSNTGSGTGQLVESDGEVQFSFQPGVTTLANLKAKLDASVYVQMTGTWNGADTIASGDNFASGVINLSGGVALGSVGVGASLTTYDGRPVWDRDVVIGTTVGDSLHSLHDILDLSAKPYAVQNSDYPEWGREVAMERNVADDWQWFKLFLSTVRGRQVAWWLPSYRDDFTFVSKATNTITVSNTDGSDVYSWWPYQRDRLQVEQADGTVTRCKITNVLDNGNGTMTLTVGVTLSGVAVSRVSWLELCRFESDDIDVTFTSATFSVQTTARVVRQ